MFSLISSALLQDLGASLRGLGKRSVLALIGIAIGSSSVVAMINIGSNAAEEAAMIFKGMGVTTLVAQLSETTQDGSAARTTLDTDHLRATIPNLMQVAPTAQTGSAVTFKGRTSYTQLVGSTAELPGAMGLTLSAGRFLSDFDQGDTYAVVGHRLAAELGTTRDPLRIGDRIRVENYLFQVVGILREQPDSLLIPVRPNDSLFLPLAGMRRVSDSAPIRDVIIRVTAEHSVNAVAMALVAPLKRLSGAKNVEIFVPQQLMDGLTRQTRTFAYLLMALGGIALIGGGTGVMNVMLMNVSQRRREIGVRMALGARRRDIRHLFMLEAITLTAVGALCGGLLGIACAYTYATVSGWTFFLAPMSLPLGVSSTLLVGVFFGLYPAVLASRLQPVEALRDE
ncbi:ABC transporter permease [Pseudomonas sp. 14P_8.1_Bac3]|uniref:ABC transporter permease n=1 Tax=Pseudomonas sp. 14P_8.1_Bac3 TaxID=2971621 RepID=UPI0021C7A200|nr:ABC transporter permease [Pseudomonas sp. 14P_8.1_Bac3]MCU1761553.1 ABC transporter permease [Pseudomonas sp. 14P_8.1_Bac3]